MTWVFSIVFGLMAAIFGLLTVTLAFISVSRLRDKEELFTPGERAFIGIFSILLSALCLVGFLVLMWLSLNFHEIAIP